MFSMEQKKHLADVVEKAILEMNSPDMPVDRPVFKLEVFGSEAWSWAVIVPNWRFTLENPPGINPWNEMQAMVKDDYNEKKKE